MKRLLALLGLTYLSVLAVVFYFGAETAFYIGIVSLLVLVISLAVRKVRRLKFVSVVSCVALVACCVNIAYTSFVYNPVVDTFADTDHNITATLVDEPKYVYDYYCYEFRATEDNILNKKFKFVVYQEEKLRMEPFDTITADFHFSQIASDTYRSQGYFLSGSLGYGKVDYSVTTSEKKPLYYYAIKLREFMRQALDNSLDNDASALCKALLVGDKYAIDEDTKDAFVRAGASHMIVVSGMHFSILAGVFLFIVRKKPRYRIPVLVIATVFIFLYMSVTGFTPSVVRSAVMLLVCIIGGFIRRDSYPLNSLSVAALVLTLPNPYIAGNVGLILSFATTYSIICLAPYIDMRLVRLLRIYKLYDTKPRAQLTDKQKKLFAFVRDFVIKTLRYFISLFSVCVSAYFSSFFLSLFFFGAFSTVAVITSFVLAVPVMLLLYCSIIICVLYYIPLVSLLVPVVSFVAQILSAIVYSCINYLSGFEFSYIYVVDNFVYLLAGFTLLLFVIGFISKKNKSVLICAMCSILIFCVAYLSNMTILNNNRYLHIYSVDSGKAVAYSSVDTQAVLELSSNKSDTLAVLHSLQNEFADIDFCSSVTNTKNSANSLKTLCSAFAIDDILLYDTDRTVSVSDTITPTGDFTVNFSDGSSATYYLVDDRYITYFESAGVTVLLLPDYVDVSLIPESMRSPHIIIMSKCPQDYQLLSCDTLCISADIDESKHLMKLCHDISNRVLLTADADIKLRLEV